VDIGSRCPLQRIHYPYRTVTPVTLFPVPVSRKSVACDPHPDPGKSEAATPILDFLKFPVDKPITFLYFSSYEYV